MDKKTKYKVAGQVLKANDDGSIRFRLITNDVDRDSEVLLPMGAQLKNWKLNPVWLWAHNSWSPPIGKIITKSIDQTETALDVDVLFDEENDGFAKMVAAKHRDGFLNATSVGFIPITISKETVKPGQKGVTFEKFEVLEGSSVPIPANPAALQQNNWGGFVDECKKYGFGNVGMGAWLKMADWSDEEIKDALQSDNLRLNIPYETQTVTTTDNLNYEITEVSQDGETKIDKSDDSKTNVEVDKEKVDTLNKLADKIAETCKELSEKGLSMAEIEAAVIPAISGLLVDTPKEKTDDTYKLIIDELNSINIHDKPDASTLILNKLKEIEIN